MDCELDKQLYDLCEEIEKDMLVDSLYDSKYDSELYNICAAVEKEFMG